MTEMTQNLEDKTAPDGAEDGKDGKAKVKFDSSMSREEAVAYFDALLEGLKQGKLNFKQGEKSLAIAPASHLHVEVKAARKGEREKVSFELSWEREQREDFEITSSE